MRLSKTLASSLSVTATVSTTMNRRNITSLVQIIIVVCAFSNILIVQSWRNFRIIQENVRTNITAPEVISRADIYIRKLNRTFDALNSSATFIIDMADSIVIHAKSYELKGTQYHPSIMDTKLDYCKFLENPSKVSIILAIFYPTVLRYSNYPKKCPVKADTYWLYNFNVNEDAFPVFFPGHRWRYIITVYYKNRMIFETIWSFRVEPKRGI